MIGRSRSYEIIEYRNAIMRELCKSPEIVKLLGCENEEYPEDVIPYEKSYPHEYIPETITKTERFINFDVAGVIDSSNNVYKNLTIYFFVVCHQDVVKYKDKGRTYLWYDKVVCELDNIFCEKNIFGVGKMSLIGNVPYSPHKNFKGRLLKFDIKDFNNGLKYGK